MNADVFWVPGESLGGSLTWHVCTERGSQVMFLSWLSFLPDVQVTRMQSVIIKELHRKGQFKLSASIMQIKQRKNNAQCLILFSSRSLKDIDSELKSP